MDKKINIAIILWVICWIAYMTITDSWWVTKSFTQYNMQSFAINPNKKTVIFYCEHQFNRSFFEMSLTDEQYIRMLEFQSNIDF